MINELDKVRLTTGERATIVEVFDENNFLAEIISKLSEIRVEDITRSDIKAKIIEIEQPLIQNV